MPLPPLVEPVAALSPAESARTARHAALYPLGEAGQRRLAAAHVAIVGAGGLGSPAVLALAAAGVGRLTVIDDDRVEASNLQRQVIHRATDVGEPKVESAVRAARDLAPECVVTPIAERLTGADAARLLAGADVVIDGSDGFATRVDVAAACEALGVPLVWGVVQEFAAQVTVFWSRPPEGAAPVRLADLYPEGSAGEPPSCSEVGVLGALTMQVGSLLATQAILLIAGIGEPLLGRLALIDGLRGTMREVALRAAAPRGTSPAPEPASRPDAPVTYLDVRNPDEWATGVIPGAVLLPLDALLAGAAARFDGPVVAVCASGVRSLHAARVLRDRGVDATSLDGGMAAWTGDVEVRA
ncbi:HesA/MoeB/ThiF family protein [Microbacterium indicum]|uniref:HesA/MoeB/ThiF family protein n=1 Tax=Microbacterium indicum TaxID=358100 RepID=UPI0004234265|nr:HesA/MoeB/ThiF family protein [Microbacterium indicum]